MEETFRLDLNQSWEAIDIKTGHAVLIPKGSHQAIRMLLKDPRDQTDENYLVVMVKDEGNSVLACQHRVAFVFDENYLVVMVKDEGNSVLAGLREAYWRQ